MNLSNKTKGAEVWVCDAASTKGHPSEPCPECRKIYVVDEEGNEGYIN